LADIRTKLKKLIQEKPKPDGTAYSLDEIAAYAHVSSSTIRHLLSFAPSNPTMDTIAALASFFGVSPGYFFEVDADNDSEGEPEVTKLYLRGGQDLSPRDKRILEEIVKLAEQLASKQGKSSDQARS